MGQAAHADGWDGILDPGERVLWQGQPDPAPDFTGWRLSDGVFGGVFSAFAMYWMLMALSQGPGGSLLGMVFPLFGVPFLILGLKRAGGDRVIDAYRRRRTWYTLTTARAFIATDAFGRKTFAAHPITPHTMLRRDGRNLWFATDPGAVQDGGTAPRIGFARLPDPSHVHDLMRQIQAEAQ